MVFERATPPALRWVLAFLGVCAALGLWLGFKDQIRRNPPAWYTGAPDPVVAGAPAADEAGIREATPFDPSARSASQQAASAATTEPKPPEKKDEPAAAPEDAAGEPAADAAAPAVAPPAATQAPAAPARPRPATPTPSRPAPSADPVGDILDGQRPPAQPAPSDVPY